jgi:hypothetical protein
MQKAYQFEYSVKGNQIIRHRLQSLNLLAFETILRCVHRIVQYCASTDVE